MSGGVWLTRPGDVQVRQALIAYWCLPLVHSRCRSLYILGSDGGEIRLELDLFGLLLFNFRLVELILLCLGELLKFSRLFAKGRYVVYQRVLVVLVARDAFEKFPQLPLQHLDACLDGYKLLVVS